ncbi:MAG: MATE family efflux transporter [Catonella sp.]|nr:MATE family efflux transporter [Catonella sp.]MDY6357503.1 MATE family efflux transporter [Catonella sp.]
METDMTKGNIFPIILKFTLPLFIGNICQMLYNMADTIIVGRFVGQKPLAAVGATGTIMFLVLGLANGLASGFTVLSSQCYGSGDMKRLKHSVSNGIMLSAIVVVVMTLASMLPMKGILELMNTPEDIFDYSYTYIMIICAGTVASVYNNLFASYLRAVGNSKMPLVFLVVSAVLNVALDLILIICFNMGVAGAALATVISQAVSALLSLLYIYKKEKILVPEKGDWHFTEADTKHQLRIGIPMALQFGITASGTMIMQAAINKFGSVAISGFTAASKINNLVTQGQPAMGTAIATFGGQNYGGGGYKRIEKGVRTINIMNIVYSIIGGIIAVTCMRPVMPLFFKAGTDIEAMIPWAKPYIIMSAICYIPLGMIFIFRNVMQGCGYGLLPMLGGVVELFARLAMAFVSFATGKYVFAAACDPFAWLTAGIFTAVAYLFVMRDIRKHIPA